jgi:hypothetical protein
MQATADHCRCLSCSLHSGGWTLPRWLDNIEEYILLVLFPLMVIVVFVATCVRYLTVMSLPWAEEVARYSMVWIAYIGASLGIKRNAHLGVEAVLLLLPQGTRKYFDYLRLCDHHSVQCPDCIFYISDHPVADLDRTGQSFAADSDVVRLWRGSGRCGIDGLALHPDDGSGR